MKILTKKDVQDFINEAKGNEKDIMTYRHIFFKHFLLSDLVPESLVKPFISIVSLFYDKTGDGYNGIMKEIIDRVFLYVDNDGAVEIRHFLKHGDGKTDIIDSFRHQSIEKKTGCGDWLRSEHSTTLEQVIEEYKRKRTRIRWDYDFVPAESTMNGYKDLKDKQVANKPKKSGKQYPIHIHIESTYKKLFEYMETYPAGIASFFKESTRSGQAGIYLWQLQTIKNSKKKILFLQAFEG